VKDLTTARLHLRANQKNDADALARLWSDPEVTRFAGGPRNYEHVRALVEGGAASAGEYRWTVVDRQTGEVFGECGLIHKVVESRPETELIYYLFPNAWGRGIATEAAGAALAFAEKELGLVRLIALVDPSHEASRRVAIKLGFRSQGVIRRGNAARELFLRESV
jgi:RimJ/RimL family protein N-acetyltransferase